MAPTDRKTSWTKKFLRLDALRETDPEVFKVEKWHMASGALGVLPSIIRWSLADAWTYIGTITQTYYVLNSFLTPVPISREIGCW